MYRLLQAGIVRICGNVEPGSLFQVAGYIIPRNGEQVGFEVLHLSKMTAFQPYLHKDVLHNIFCNFLGGSQLIGDIINTVLILMKDDLKRVMVPSGYQQKQLVLILYVML